MKVNGASVNDKAGPDGKTCKAVMEPVLQHGPENRWGVWVTGFGDFVNVDGDGNAQVISTYVNYDGQLRSVRKWSRSFFLLVRASFSPRF
jgi:hypothetical protein